MFEAFALVSLKSQIKRENALRSKTFYNWNQIQKIALLISNTDQVSKHNIDLFIDRSQKFIDVFYVEINAKTATYHDWTCFTKADKNILGLPHKSAIRMLHGRKYDLVIDTIKDAALFSASICSTLQSPLKCANKSTFEYSDLIIHRSENQELLPYLEEVVKYLKMIKT